MVIQCTKCLRTPPCEHVSWAEMYPGLEYLNPNPRPKFMEPPAIVTTPADSTAQRREDKMGEPKLYKVGQRVRLKPWVAGPFQRKGRIYEVRPQNGGYLVKHDKDGFLGLWGRQAILGWMFDEVEKI